MVHRGHFRVGADMFHHAKIKIDSESKKEVLEAVGENIDYFRSNMEALKGIWQLVAQKIGDCDEVRLMGKVLFSDLTPVNAAIISDNLDFFKKHYQMTAEIDENLLRITCLCGAEEITNYLLEKCHNPLQKYDFILTYVSTSPNEEWVKRIASEMHNKNMEIPKGIYVFCFDSERVALIVNIFDSKQGSASPKMK